MHDVDIERLCQHRYTGTTQNWSDRRRDLYHVAYHDGPENLGV